MVIHAFYNPEHVGDVLLCKIRNEDCFQYESNGDLTTLYNENKDVVGYNIFHISCYLDDLVTGINFLSQKDLDILHDQFGIEGTCSKDIVVGQVLSLEEHPDSDHLHICQVDVKDEVLQIVCGAPNVDKGQKVVVAKIGAVMPDGKFIEPSSLRGVQSDGMLCAARELYLPGAPNVRGILVLDDTYEVGDDFFEKYRKGE